VKTHLRRRGAAAVEMSITMVVLIPLIFFALFLEDFVYYRLNGQEPLISAQWDHVTPDYMKQAPDVGGMNRLKYCDHTAAFDSYQQQFDCQGAGGAEEDDDGGGGGGLGISGGGGGSKIGHHHATGAHQCWLGGGQQLRCSVDRSGGVDIVQGKPMTGFHGATTWNRGGLATCSAQLNVFNWIIPKSISQGGGWLWSKKENINKTQYGKAGGGDNAGSKEWNENYSIADAHTDGSSSGGGTGSWLMSKEELSMMVDPWALTHIDAVYPLSMALLTVKNPPGKVVGIDAPYNPLLARTGWYYNLYAKEGLNKAHMWHRDMKFFLDPKSQEDGYGDHLHSVPVMWKPEKERTGYKGGYASGYEDSRQKSANRPNKFPETWGPKP
jgi:hypothetical protein